MANLYVTLPTLKGTGVLNLGTGTQYDAALTRLSEAVSRQVDLYTHRTFFFIEEIRTLDGQGEAYLLVDDFIAATSVKEDSNNDGTYDVTWATGDYALWPYNANPTAEWGRPYTQLLLDLRAGTQDIFLKGRQNYQISATWGYRKITVDTGLDGSGTLTSTATSLVMTGGTLGTLIEVGHTVVLDNEQMLITSADSTATAATIERAKNGSTATAHPTSNINVVRYPQAVTEAVIIQTARLWKRKDSAFAAEIGMTEAGQMTVFRGLDPDIKILLAPYKRIFI